MKKDDELVLILRDEDKRDPGLAKTRKDCAAILEGIEPQKRRPAEQRPSKPRTTPPAARAVQPAGH